MSFVLSCCIPQECHGLALPRRGLPRNAMPCPPPPAWSRAPLSSSPSAIDISAVSSPAYPTIVSQTRIHFGFRTCSPSVLCPVLPCPFCPFYPALSIKVGAQPVRPASLSACLPASLATLVSSFVFWCGSRFDLLCIALHRFALLLPCPALRGVACVLRCFALLAQLLQFHPVFLPLTSGRYHHLSFGRCSSLQCRPSTNVIGLGCSVDYRDAPSTSSSGFPAGRRGRPLTPPSSWEPPLPHGATIDLPLQAPPTLRRIPMSAQTCTFPSCRPQPRMFPAWPNTYSHAYTRSYAHSARFLGHTHTHTERERERDIHLRT
jgi:hypothetical protein